MTDQVEVNTEPVRRTGSGARRRRTGLTEDAGRYALYAFLINLAAAAIAFGGYIIYYRGLFSVAGDFNVQQIPFAMYANDAIKSGNVVWDWSLDLGSNFIGGMTFYLLGNPSFWISLLFPSKAFIYIVGWLYVLKYGLAGLTSYLWIRRFVKHPSNAVIASTMYAFSGFMNENLLFYHFHDVVVLFPLLLIGFDELMEKRKHGFFIGAVVLNLLVNYFFFPGDVLFLGAYYILRYVVLDGKKAWRRLPEILLDGALGCGITMVLMLPAAIFVLQNPRVSFDYVGSNSLVFGLERYLFILKALIFPGEVMSDQSAVINHNFSSCAAYIPMIGLIYTIAFLRMNRKHWLTRMLKWCLVMAVVPILNASFSMFAGLYHRWYYMPVLLFALSGAYVLEQLEMEDGVWASPTPAERAVHAGSVIWAVIVAGFLVFLVFVPWSSSEKSKIYRDDVFFAWSMVAVAGVILTWVLSTQVRRHRRLLIEIGILAFSIGTLASLIHLYHVANGEEADGLEDRLVTSADFGLDTTSYRYSNRDNPETLTHGYSASANFCSTVSGSIFRLYEALGLSRDVKSPEAPVGFNNLISARYSYETSRPEEGEKPVRTVKGRSRTYYLYENEDIPPIGFTYDTYMTASEFSETATATRAILMLKTLVIPDDQEAEVSQVLRHYDEAVDGSATEADLTEISRLHLAECTSSAVRTTSTYTAELHAAAETYAFFSIPDDSGWSATVNGRKTEIVDINGFMAVRISAGDNTIVFSYTVPGLRAGAAVSAVSLTAAAIWIGLTRRRRLKAA